MAKTKLKGAWETTKNLAWLVGIMTKEYALLAITKAIQSRINTNDAVITLNGEAIGNLKFDIVESNILNLQSETTDNYIDTNRPVQDHIIRKPIEITLKGQVGRYLNDVTKNQGHSPIYYRNMNLITAYIPKIPGIGIATKVRQKISTISGDGIIGSLINSVTSYAYGLGMELLNTAWHAALEKFSLSPAYILEKSKNSTGNREQQAFQDFYTLWQLGQELTVHTFWWKFDNMIITNLRPLKEQGDITEFTITLKQLNKVSSIVTNNVKTAKEPVQGQKSKSVNNGKTKGTEKSLPPLENIK